MNLFLKRCSNFSNSAYLELPGTKIFRKSSLVFNTHYVFVVSTWNSCYTFEISNYEQISDILYDW